MMASPEQKVVEFISQVILRKPPKLWPPQRLSKYLPNVFLLRKGIMVHPAQAALLDFFAHDHLPEGIMRDTSHECSLLAHHVTFALEDTTNGAELTTGLRKLLEAKDCFVRAAMSVPKQQAKEEPPEFKNA